MNATTRPRRTIAAAAAILTIAGALTACDPAPPPPPPTGSGAATATPRPQDSASPTVSEEDQAYTAAKKAYTNANRIIDTAVNKGAAEFPESLDTWADPDGDYYKAQLRGLKGLHEQGIRYDGMSKVAQMYPPEGAVYNPNQISMYTCVDSRGVDSVETSTGDVIEKGGDIVAFTLVFKRTGEKEPDGQRAWQVWGYQGGEPNFDVVDKCKEPPK